MIHYVISFLLLALYSQSHGMITGLRGPLSKSPSTYIQRTVPRRTLYAKPQVYPATSYTTKSGTITTPSGKPIIQPVAHLSLWQRFLSLAGLPTRRSFYTSTAPQNKGFWGRLFGTTEPTQPSIQEVSPIHEAVQEIKVSTPTKTPQEWFSVADAYLNGSISAKDFEEKIPQYKSVINTKRPIEVTDIYGNKKIIEQSVLETLLDKIAYMDLLRGFDPSKPLTLLSLDQFEESIKKIPVSYLSNIINTLIDNGAVLEDFITEKFLLQTFYLDRYLAFIARGHAPRTLEITMRELGFTIRVILGKLFGMNFKTGMTASGKDYQRMQNNLIDKSYTDFKELVLRNKELALRNEIQEHENRLATIPAKNKNDINRIQKIIDIKKSRIENNELGEQYDEKYEKELEKYSYFTIIEDAASKPKPKKQMSSALQTQFKRSFHTSTAPQSKGFFGRLFGTVTPQEWFNVSDAYLNGSMSAEQFEKEIPKYKSVINQERPVEVTDVYGNTKIVHQTVLETLFKQATFSSLFEGAVASKPYLLPDPQILVAQLEEELKNNNELERKLNPISILIANGATLSKEMIQNWVFNDLRLELYLRWPTFVERRQAARISDSQLLIWHRLLLKRMIEPLLKKLHISYDDILASVIENRPEIELFLGEFIQNRKALEHKANNEVGELLKKRGELGQQGEEYDEKYDDLIKGVYKKSELPGHSYLKRQTHIGPTQFKRSFHTSIAPRSKGFFGRLFGTVTPQEWFSVADAYLNGSMTAEQFKEEIPKYKSVINTKRPQQVTDIYGNTYTIEQTILETIIEQFAFVDIFRGLDPSNVNTIIVLDPLMKKIAKLIDGSAELGEFQSEIGVIYTLRAMGALLDRNIVQQVFLTSFYIEEYINRGSDFGIRLPNIPGFTLHKLQVYYKDTIRLFLVKTIESLGLTYHILSNELRTKAHNDISEFLFRQHVIQKEKEINQLKKDHPEATSMIRMMEARLQIDKNRIANKEYGKEFDAKFEINKEAIATQYMKK